jgi:hypothetical protein
MAVLARSLPVIGGRLERAPELDHLFAGSHVYRAHRPTVSELAAIAPGAFYVGPLGKPAIDVVYPDPSAPAHVGDPVPNHPFFAPMPAALGPVLRTDSSLVRELISAREFLDQMALVYPDRPARPAAPSRLRRLWEVYHEWITAGFFIGVALAAAAFNH